MDPKRKMQKELLEVRRKLCAVRLDRRNAQDQTVATQKSIMENELRIEEMKHYLRQLIGSVPILREREKELEMKVLQVNAGLKATIDYAKDEKKKERRDDKIERLRREIEEIERKIAEA